MDMTKTNEVVILVQESEPTIEYLPVTRRLVIDGEIIDPAAIAALRGMVGDGVMIEAEAMKDYFAGRIRRVRKY